MPGLELPPPPEDVWELDNDEILEEFLAALMAAGASEKTIKSYRAAISDFLSFIKGRSLREVRSSDVRKWLQSRLGRVRGGWDEKRRVQVTMHYYSIFLRRFFRWLGLRVRVPVVRKPRRGVVEALSREEVLKLLGAARDTLDLLIVSLLLETGLRAEEAVSLRLRDIDLERREIRVRNAKYGEERIVFFGEMTAEALKAWLSENPGLRPDDKLLGISYSALYKRLKKMARRAGLDPARVRPHVLRHTFATEALRRGMSLPAVQRLLGHHDVRVTEIYLHLVNDDIKREYEAAFGRLRGRGRLLEEAEV